MGKGLQPPRQVLTFPDEGTEAQGERAFTQGCALFVFPEPRITGPGQAPCAMLQGRNDPNTKSLLMPGGRRVSKWPC